MSAQFNSVRNLSGEGERPCRCLSGTFRHERGCGRGCEHRRLSFLRRCCVPLREARAGGTWRDDGARCWAGGFCAGKGRRSASRAAESGGGFFLGRGESYAAGLCLGGLCGVSPRIQRETAATDGRLRAGAREKLNRGPHPMLRGCGARRGECAELCGSRSGEFSQARGPSPGLAAGGIDNGIFVQAQKRAGSRFLPCEIRGARSRCERRRTRRQGKTFLACAGNPCAARASALCPSSAGGQQKAPVRTRSRGSFAAAEPRTISG